MANDSGSGTKMKSIHSPKAAHRSASISWWPTAVKETPLSYRDGNEFACRRAIKSPGSNTTCSMVRQPAFHCCRRKMRMSGLCKVEMSAFMDGRGPHGDGANCVEPTRTGPVESVARDTAEASDAGSWGHEAEHKRPPGAADAAAPSRARRSLPGSRTARPTIEPQAAGPLGAEDFGAPAAALCGFRTHAGCRTPGPGGFLREPGDATEVDDQSGLVAPALAAREGRACVAGAPSQFRGAGDAGQLTVPLVGGTRSGLPAHRPDRRCHQSHLGTVHRTRHHGREPANVWRMGTALRTSFGPLHR